VTGGDARQIVVADIDAHHVYQRVHEDVVDPSDGATAESRPASRATRCFHLNVAESGRAQSARFRLRRRVEITAEDDTIQILSTAQPAWTEEGVDLE